MDLSPAVYPSYATTLFDQLELEGLVASSDVEELEEQRALMDPEKYWGTASGLVRVRGLSRQESKDQSIVDMTRDSTVGILPNTSRLPLWLIMYYSSLDFIYFQYRWCSTCNADFTSLREI